MSPKLSVIICSLNGAEGVERCLRALERQTTRSSLELILVDDGSSDETTAVGVAHGIIVITHAVNQGLAAARNSGIAAASAPIVAFLDDDCEPEPSWAEHVLAEYKADVIGVGGPIVPQTHRGFMLGYLQRNNPLKPQELNLARSDKLLYRFYLYARRQWTGPADSDRRDVYSYAGANMSFRRQFLARVGLFDERFRFGAEELDLCMRLNHYGLGRLVFSPEARVVHHFQPSLGDTLRRSRAYGRGSARLYRKWSSVLPTIFPGPLIFLILILLSILMTPLWAATALAPLAIYPHGLRSLLRGQSKASLLDGYVQLLQEAEETLGFVQGLILFRHLVPGVEPLRHILPDTGHNETATPEVEYVS